jgi:tetratricopeptide (TPR) repeat protein
LAACKKASSELASQWGEDASQLNLLSWTVVSRPDATQQKYDLALRQAEAACRLQSDNRSYLNTLGVARYRVRKYPEALASLLRSDKLSSTLKGGRQYEDLAFLAMAYFKLGQNAKAQALLGELRQLIKLPKWSDNPEALGFLREAEDVVAGKQ